MSDRNGPSPVPPLSQSLAESSLGREHGLYVNATVDIKLLSSNLGKPWRLSTNYAPCLAESGNTGRRTGFRES